MTVYGLIEVEITNLDGMAPYIQAVPATIAAHGGKILVAPTGNMEVVEGGLGAYPSKIILEFPSIAAAKGWYYSEEYQAIRPYRRKHSKSNVIWVEGV